MNDAIPSNSVPDALITTLSPIPDAAGSAYISFRVLSSAVKKSLLPAAV